MTGAPPDPDRTIHIVGDMHIGSVLQSRLDTAAADFALVSESYAHRVYVGDIMEDRNLGGRYDNDALAWFAAVEPDRGRYSVLPGNHDFAGGNRDDFATLLGEANWAKDLGFCRVIAISPFRNWDETKTQTLQAEDLAWLDEQLAASNVDTIVFSHGSLYGTVGGSLGGAGFSSFIDGGPIYPDADVRAVIRLHPHVRGWIGGHTHSRLSNAGVVTDYPIAEHIIAAINASALTYLNPNGDQETDPLCSLFVSVYDERVEVRARDHAAQEWTTIDAEDVVTIPIRHDGSPRFRDANPLQALITFDGTATGRTRAGELTASVTGTKRYADGPWAGTLGLIVDSSSVVSLPTENVLNVDQGAIAVMVALGPGSDASIDDPYVIYHNNSGNRLYIRQGRAADRNTLAILGNANTQVSGDANLPYEQWLTVGLNWDGSAVTLFLDGVPVISGTYAGFNTLGTTFSLGSAGGILPINGPLGPFASFSRPLSRDEHTRIALRGRQWTISMLERPRRFAEADVRRAAL